MNRDTDPTPAHGTERPTKTHVLDRQLAQLRAQRQLVLDELVAARATVAIQKRNLQQLDEDIATIEQLLMDLFPEPLD